MKAIKPLGMVLPNQLAARPLEPIPPGNTGKRIWHPSGLSQGRGQEVGH